MSQTQLEFTPEELAAIRKEYAAGATDEQFTLFVSECKRRSLIPGRHVVFQQRRTKEYDPDTNSKVWTSKPVYITTVAALRLIAQRTGEYTGQGREVYVYLPEEDETPNENGFVTSPYPLPDPKLPHKPRIPWIVETTIYRKGFEQPMSGIARWDAYAAYQKSADGGRTLTQMWSQRGPEMLAKCSESLGLRRAFPEETDRLLISEELKPDEDDLPVAPVTPASVVPMPAAAPPVEQTPAQPTETPRPGEPEKPEPKKRGRKPKRQEPEVPESTQITEEDFNSMGTPLPQTEDHKREAQNMVEEVTSFTVEEARAQGLPDPPDPIPDKEQYAEFVSRVRAYMAEGHDSQALKQYLLREGDKTDTKFLTVGNWKAALTKLDQAKKDGKVKEVLNAN